MKGPTPVLMSVSTSNESVGKSHPSPPGEESLARDLLEVPNQIYLI
jgi:hypothetical protein